VVDQTVSPAGPRTFSRLSLFSRAFPKFPMEACRRVRRVRDDLMMKHHYLEIVLTVYFLLGLLGYSNIGGVGAAFDASKKPSLFRRLLVILFWPLAMIGAIEG